MPNKHLTPREAIDPHGTLPPVELVKDDEQLYENDGGSHDITTHSLYANGQRIGEAIITDDRSTHTSWFNDIRIQNEDFRDGGFGTAAYLEAIEAAHRKGNTFRTHEWSQSESAKKVWDRLIDASVVNVVEPFTSYVIGSTSKTQLYKGHVEVPPPSQREVSH